MKHDEPMDELSFWRLTQGVERNRRVETNPEYALWARRCRYLWELKNVVWLREGGRWSAHAPEGEELARLEAKGTSGRWMHRATLVAELAATKR